ncbi:helix-turn-helix transcriptional regulator [Candidatus Binatus sp.]|uniref:helix-turn-helix transcriptional regulator n=1 Tax=Candidatus Binatus sp. TaxID=2811406 RepID=UPI003C6F9F71
MRSSSNSQSPEITDPVLATRDVVELVGLHQVTIWRLCREGQFPAPMKITGRKNGWLRSEIINWLATRPHAAYGAARAA